jgi:hypothetical protein
MPLKSVPQFANVWRIRRAAECARVLSAAMFYSNSIAKVEVANNICEAEILCCRAASKICTPTGRGNLGRMIICWTGFHNKQALPQIVPPHSKLRPVSLQLCYISKPPTSSRNKNFITETIDISIRTLVPLLMANHRHCQLISIWISGGWNRCLRFPCQSVTG